MPGTIDQLNFEVILDDKEFTAKVKQDIQLANQLNTSLSSLLNIKKQVGKFTQDDVTNNRKAQQILVDSARAQERITREKVRTEGVQKKINAQIERATKGYQSQSRILQELKGYALGYLSIHGATQLLSSLVRVTGEFELQKTTLAAMLGDLNQAEQVITRIQGLAVESPFQFKELTTYAKQLSAFSVPAQELYDTTKMLADISAGLGVGMDRIVLAYGQVRSAAFLRGQEVRQFTEAGIPILDELAKQFSELEGRAVSAGEVFDKISARLVSFEMVAKVFKDMTSEGGKFYNMQEIQAETLRGKISNLKDAYEVMLNEIGKGQSENLKGAVDWARRLMQNYEEIGRVLVELITTYGIYKGVLITVTAATNTFTLANHKLLSVLVNAGKWLKANPYVAIAAAVTAAGYAVYKASTALQGYEKIQRSVVKSEEEFTTAVNTENAKLDALYSKLKMAKEGSEEYAQAKKQIYSQYAGYISELKAEGKEVNNLVSIYQNLKDKIEETQKSRFLSSATKDIESTYADEMLDIDKRFKWMITRYTKMAKRELTYDEKEGLWQYIIGNEKAWKKSEVEELRNLVENDSYNLFLVEKIKSDVKKISDAYTEGLTNIENAFTSLTKKREQASSEELTLFAQTVQDTLGKLGINKENKGKFGNIWAENSTNYYDYLDKLRKGYEEVKQKIKDVGSTQKANLPDLQKQKEAIEAIAKALKISLDKGDYGKGKSQAQIDLEVQIDLVKKLQDAYEKLDPFVDDKTMKSTLSKFFPDAKKEWIDSLDFTTVLKSLADELEKYDKDAAERLRNSLGKTGIDGEAERLKNLQKGYKESAKAAGEYFNTLRKWASEDFNLNGEGIALDVSKIASDLNEKINEIELRATKARELFGQIDLDSEEEVAKVKEIFVKEFGSDAWEDFWNNYYTEGVAAIDRLTAKQKEYEKKLAQERVNDLAQKYVKESYFEGNIELTELSDKNFFQLRELRKKLQELLDKEPLQVSVELKKDLADYGVDVSNMAGVDLDYLFKDWDDLGKPISEADQEMLKLIQNIQKAGLSTKDFGDVIKKVIGGDLKNLTKEEGEALLGMVESYMGEIQNLMSSIVDFAEAIGNEELEGAVNGIAESMEILGSVADKLAKGDWVGAIISGVTSLATTVMDAVTAQYALNDAIAETRNEMLLLNSQNAINEGVESIFGTDDYKKFQNAYDEIIKAHATAINDLEKQNQNFWGRSKDNWGVAGVAGSLAAGAGLGAAIGSIFPVVGTAIGAGIGALVGMVVGLVGNAATTANDYAITLQQMADEIGADLIDAETGLFNIETLKSIKKTYSDLDKNYQKMLDDLITNVEIFENAVTEMATYMTDIFGQCADEMADAFINSFKESGQAALEYGDIMSALATDIAKSVIKSTILQNVFSEDDARKAAVALGSGNLGGALAVVDNAMQAAQELTPYIQELLESLKPYFDMEQPEGESLGDGIKGITEDTANLLASYLNAIRADVSYARTIWERMDATTQQIAVMLTGFSAPNLMEYQMQIAANTYNTAMYTQSIMEDLRSVITSTDGPTGIRVYS